MNPYSVRRKSFVWFPYEMYISEPFEIGEEAVMT